jgi:glycosyltransferase involved in cell wall biosynthesis
MRFILESDDGTMEKKKLLIFLGSLGRGGAERVISLISDYFCKRDWNVTIALLLSNKVDYQMNEAVKIVNLAGNERSRIKRVPKWFTGIRKLTKKEKPDVILSFAARINVLVQISCFGLKTPIVVSERNDPYMDGRPSSIDKMTTWLYPKAKVVVFQTKRAERYFEKAKLTNKTIITNPISVNVVAGTPVHGKIVTAGRLTSQKNHKLLVDAFFEVAKKHQQAELYIYGSGELRDTLEKQAEELKIGGRVHLMGNVPNIHEQISDANAFVLSSDYEGLSNALLEAMMMGLPCISTDCAGSDEYIKDRENGLLVPVGDKDALVSGMLEVLENKELALLLGKNAREASVVFAKDNVLDEWFELISGE